MGHAIVKRLRDVSGAVTLAGRSPVSSVNPAQDLCEPLQMAAVTAEEQILTPRPVLTVCSLSPALTPATSSTACIKRCAVVHLGLTDKVLQQNFRSSCKSSGMVSVTSAVNSGFLKNEYSSIFVAIERTTFVLSTILFVLTCIFHLLILFYSAVVSSVKLHFNVLVQ